MLGSISYEVTFMDPCESTTIKINDNLLPTLAIEYIVWDTAYTVALDSSSYVSSSAEPQVTCPIIEFNLLCLNSNNDYVSCNALT